MQKLYSKLENSDGTEGLASFKLLSQRPSTHDFQTLACAESPLLGPQFSYLTLEFPNSDEVPPQDHQKLLRYYLDLESCSSAIRFADRLINEK